MTSHKPPLRDRLLSNSPDPIKTSILRESGMGWNSPASNLGSTSSASSGSAISPLRIAKRDSPARAIPQPQVARRSSSSYKHVRNNNLVSKSPFKSQIPAPLATPSRHTPITFPSGRRVSGEKRPRPSSMYEQAENENERPFSLKRERKQSKGLQGLMQKEPVTRSPFKQRTPSVEEQPPLPPPPFHQVSRMPIPSFFASPAPTQAIHTPMPVPASGAPPARSSLVSRRMHGPRLSGGGGKRERKKKVTFDELCNVVEYDREEETDEDVFDSAEEDENEAAHAVQPEHGCYPEVGRSSQDQYLGHGDLAELRVEDDGDLSYESIQLSDIDPDGNATASLLGMELDPDTSISGLVDEMLFSSNAVNREAPTSSPSHHNVDLHVDDTTDIGTPPRYDNITDLPTDLETEDGIPFGRSHHVERLLEHHQRGQSHSSQPPPHFSPHQHQRQSCSPHHQPQPQCSSHQPYPSSGYPFNFNLPTHASPQGPPATPPRRSMAPSPSAAAAHRLGTVTEDANRVPGPIPTHTVASEHQSTPLFGAGSTHPTTPPLGRSTHTERIRMARVEEDEDADVDMLPGTPSPNKTMKRDGDVRREDDLIPRFGLGVRFEDSATKQAAVVDDPFALPNIKKLTHPSTSREVGQEEGPIDPANLSTEGSELGFRMPNLDKDVEVEIVGAMSHLEESDGDVPFSRTGDDENTQDEETIRSLQDGVTRRTLQSHEAAGATPIRAASPDSRPSSPLGLDASSSNKSLSIIETGVRQRIGRENVRRRLRRSFDSPSSDNASPSPAPTWEAEGRQNEAIQSGKEEAERDRLSVVTTMTDMSAEMATIEKAEMRSLTIVGAGQERDFSMMNLGKGLQFDFGSKFGLGGLGIGNAEYGTSGSVNSRDSLGMMNVASVDGEKMGSVKSGGSVKMGDVDVDMDMRSALDRLIDDVAGTKADGSMATNEGNSYEQEREQQSYTPARLDSMKLDRAATDSALLHNGFASRNPSGSSVLTVPPPVPPKDNIRSREQMILEKRREARRMEEEESSGHYPPPRTGGGKRGQEPLGVGRPSRRRSMSTGDAEALGGGAKRRGDALLDVAEVGKEDPLGDSIERELKKLVGDSHKSKYLVRERKGTIYASSSDPDQISHMAGPGDVNAGRAWRPVRRPSDMNEYSKQIKEYRAQEKPGKAYGKVFVKVLGIKGMHLPLPQQPTALTCTLNNGIHFVSTPECHLGRDSRIEQEFELIEHSKLEFTLTLKIRRDPHIIAQFKAVAPTPIPIPAPQPIVQTSSKGGMRSFFLSSPKKSSKEKVALQPPVPPPAQRLTENLARYLKPDGTLARAFISFKDIASHCDTRLFETSYPLIGQRMELGSKFSTLQVGEIVLQMFRLPPLPGIASDQLPQSLEECHRGLRHINWHKVTYFEGTLTQSGGDCSTWRRRQLRVIGANLVAFNDVTKKATATIDLKKAIAVEDDQEARNNALIPTSGSMSHSSRNADEYDGLYGVERSFRLIFPQEQEIIFFADTNEEKARWLEVLRALVGHIPPHPLWAELLWQRQDELAKRNQPAPVTSMHVDQSTSYVVGRIQQR